MLRRVLLLLGGVLATLLLIVIGAFAYAQTSLGKQQIADVVADQLSSPQQQAEVKEVSGLLPFDVRLGELRLRDKDGVWLAVDNVRLELSPTALLKGQVAVKQVGAERVAVERLPPPGPEAPPEPPSEEPFSLPELPQLPESLPVVSVDRIFVDTIELGQPVLGEAARFTLDGAATTGPDGRKADARLSLRRTDEATAALNLAAGLDLVTQNLSIDLQGNETGGLLAAATGRPEAGALRLSLQGSGPLSDWQGRLAAEAERLAKLDLGVDLAYASERRIGIAGTFDAQPGALPPAIADVVGTRAELALRAGEIAPQRFAIQDLKLQAASLSLGGTGSADLAANTIDGALTLDVPDLVRFAGLAGTPLAGNVVLRLQAAGAAKQPRLTLTLDGRNVTAAQAALQRLGATFNVDVLSPLGEGPIGLRATGKAETAGLALDGRPVGQDGRIALDLAGELPAQGDATLQTLALRSSLFEVTGRGAIDRERLIGTARVDANVPALASIVATFAPDAGAAARIAGAFKLGADVTLGEQARRIDIALAGGGEGLRGLPPGAMQLVGPKPTIQVKAVIEPAKAATVQSLVIQGEGVRLEGDPRFGLADKALGGGIRVSLPDLGRLEPVVGQPVTGSLALQTGLGGTVERPDVKLDGTLQKLAIAGQAFDKIALAAQATGPTDALGGSAQLTAERAGQQVSLRSNYKLAGQQLNLTGLQLQGPGTQLGGDVEVGLDKPLARGRLAGGVQDLAALEAWIGQKLAGSAKLDLQLATPNGRQDARLQLDANGISGDFGKLQSAQLQGSIQDALQRRAIDATLRAQGFAAPDIALDEATVDLGGTLADLTVAARAAGNQGGQPFNLKANAALAVLDPRKSVRLTAIEGTVAGQDAKLMRPATIVLDQGVLNIDQLDLQLGPARAQGSLQFGDGRIRAGLELDTLPLAMLHGFGAPELAGTASGRLSVTGSARAPQGELTLNVAKLALGPDAPATVNVALNGGLRDGRLAADLRLTGLGQEPVTAEVAMPFGLSLEPVAVALRDDAPLSGSVRGRIELPRMAQFAALDGVQLGGNLDLGLTVGGALNAPELRGRAGITQGLVQEVSTGVTLRDLRLGIEAAGNRFVITDLSARDRGDGRLAGQGSVVLGGERGAIYDIAVNLARARVLDNDLGVVLLSGDLSLTGDTGEAAAGGKLRVEHADITIPGGGGANVPVLPVREVYGGREVAAMEPAAGPPFAVKLDIGVEAPARLFVRGRGLESEWGGNIAVKGMASEPLVTGRLEFRRGFLDLLNRRFTIEQGKIVFAGGTPPTPMLDIVASARTAEIRGIVKLSGPATDPKLELDSDPKLPQDEILSRLLFGRSVARITPVQGLRLAAAVRELQGGGGGLDSVLNTLRRTLGVDTLDVESDGESGQTTAKAGKYISDRVFLEVERGVADSSGKARVQVELTPNLSVGTEVTESSQTGVGVQWRYDY